MSQYTLLPLAGLIEECGECRSGAHSKGINVGEQNGRWKGDAATEDGKRKRAHRIVAVAGPCQVCGVVPARERHHKDGNPGNNSIENILLCCRRCHMTIDGRLAACTQRLRPYGTSVNNGHRKVTAEQVAEMRTLRKAGAATYDELAQHYGISPTTAYQICARLTWRSVP